MTSSHLITDTGDFLGFLRTKFKFGLIHNSNFFFRDLHYGVMAYLASKGRHAGYTRSEKIARELAADLERAGILKKIDYQSWCVNYPEFALPRVEKTPAAAGA